MFLVDDLPKDDAIAVDLLTNIRAYFTDAASKSETPRHLFVFAGSDDLVDLTTLYYARSSFNIAHEVQLEDFSQAESRDLILRLTGPTDRAALFDDDTIERVFALTLGHPYLVQFLCSWIYDHPERRDAVLASDDEAVHLCHIDASTNAKTMMRRLAQDEGMAKERALLANLVLDRQPVPFTPTVRAHRTLQLQGCIRDHNGLCVVRNPIYEAIFRRFFEALRPPDRVKEADLLDDVMYLLAKILTGDASRDGNLLYQAFRGIEPDPSGNLGRGGAPKDMAAEWTRRLRRYKCLEGRSALSLLLEAGYKDQQEPKPNHFPSFADLLKALDAPCAEQAHSAPPAFPAPRHIQGREATAPKLAPNTPQPAAAAAAPTAVSMTHEQQDRLKALLEAVFKGMNAAARRAFVRDAIGRGHEALKHIPEAAWDQTPSVAADTVADALYRHCHLPARGGYDLVAAINRQVRAQKLDGNPDIQPHLE